MRVAGHEEDRSARLGELEDPVILVIDAVSNLHRGLDDPPPEAATTSARMVAYSSAFGAGQRNPSGSVKTRRTLRRTWGESHRKNSCPSLTMPRQSAAGERASGGGLGHDQKELLPATTAATRALTSKVTGRCAPSTMRRALGQDPLGDRLDVRLGEPHLAAVLDAKSLELPQALGAVEDFHVAQRDAEEGAAISLGEALAELLEPPQVFLRNREADGDGSHGHTPTPRANLAFRL